MWTNTWSIVTCFTRLVNVRKNSFHWIHSYQWWNGWKKTKEICHLWELRVNIKDCVTSFHGGMEIKWVEPTSQDKPWYSAGHTHCSTELTRGLLVTALVVVSMETSRRLQNINNQIKEWGYKIEMRFWTWFLSIRILQVALSKDGKSEIVRDARVNMNKLFCRLQFIPPSNISKIMNQRYNHL